MSHHMPSDVRRQPSLLLGLCVLAVVASLWQPHSPDAIDLAARNIGLSWLHPMGTDHLGRDVLSRLLVGFARTLAAVAIVGSVCVGLGLAVGVLASSVQGAPRAALLRIAEFASVVPSLVAAIAIVALFGNSTLVVGLALAAGAWGPHALLAFGLAERARAETYVRAAGALGGGRAHVLRRHVLPAILDTQLAYLGAKIGRVVIAYSALAFLGLGADASRPDWGAMLFEYRLSMFDQPALMLWPGLAIVLLCVALREGIGWDKDAPRPAL
jgi:peptide/nickel transport system permease protein